MKAKEKHEQEFSDAFARSFIAWQAVEMQLSFLYVTLWRKRDQTRNDPLVVLSYRAVISLDARLDMIDAVLKRQLDDHPAMLERWAKLGKRVFKKSKRRNALAHFVLVNEGKDGRPRYTLQPTVIQVGDKVMYDIPQIIDFGLSFKRLADDLHRYSMDVLKLWH